MQDIADSSLLWEEIPHVIKDALGINKLSSSISISLMSLLDMHNRLLRDNLRHFGGYEVRFEGDAFFMVFSSILNAARWCVQCQLGLLSMKWPEELLQHPG